MLRNRTNLCVSRRKKALRGAVENLENRLALDASMLLDINTSPIAAGSYPRDFTAVGEDVYFVVSDSFTDELWKTDGTAVEKVLDRDTELRRSDNPITGLRKIFDIRQQNDGLVVQTNINAIYIDSGFDPLNLDLAYSFRGIRGNTNSWTFDITTTELRRSDPGTVGTRLLSGLTNDGAENTSNYAILNDKVIVSSNTQVFSSDGTPEGSDVLIRLDGSTRSFQTVDQDVFFFVSTATNYELWSTDGSTEGTQLVSELYAYTDQQLADIGSGELVPPVFVSQTFATNDRLYFVYDHPFDDLPQQLWTSDGTAVGTAPITDLTTSDASQSPEQDRIEFANYNNQLFFPKRTAVGNKLWTSDGTVVGTRLVADINPGLEDSDPQQFFVYNNQLMFQAETTAHGLEQWSTDGTTEGTTLLRDVNPGPGGSDPDEFVAWDDQLVFAAYTDALGIELWSTDGTRDGTQLLLDLAPGFLNGTPNEISVIGDKLYFSSEAGETGFEPWVSDGTVEGTYLLANIRAEQTDSAQPRELTVVDNRIFFTANDGVHGQELWSTDGTTGGTHLVIDIAAGTESSDIDEVTVAGDRVFFTAADEEHGRELWVSDGTSDGTRLVTDLLPGGGGSFPFGLTAVGESVYFTPFDDGELWISDGTEDGTRRVTQETSAGAFDAYLGITEANGVTYFVSPPAPFEAPTLWATDGTPAGTRLADPDLGESCSGDPNIHSLVNHNDDLYFLAFRHLWRVRVNGSVPEQITGSDSVLTGYDFEDPCSGPFDKVAMTEDSLVLIDLVGNSSESPKMWSFNPQSERVQNFAEPPRDEFDLNEIAFTESISFGNTLFVDNYSSSLPGIAAFTADGRETVFSDRTVEDLGVPVNNLAIINNVLYFVANSNSSGIELWESDGTPEGTMTITDIAPGEQDGFPSQFVQFGDAIYFRADDGQHGSELYRYELPPAVEFTADHYSIGENGVTIGNAITLQRSGSTDTPLNVTIDFLEVATDPSAEIGVDFNGVQQSLAFSIGESEITIPIEVFEDETKEQAEEFQLQLTLKEPSNTIRTLRQRTTVTIADNDPDLADVDANGWIASGDLDNMVLLVQSNRFSFSADLNHDLRVDLDDISLWLELAGPTLNPTGNAFRMGDANLNGIVDAFDRPRLFTFGGWSRGWSKKDFNADGVVDVSDFNIWFDNRFKAPLTSSK